MRRMLSRLLIPSLVVALAATVVACGEPEDDDDDQDQQDDETAELSVTVDDQTLEEDEADVVTIDEAQIDEEGFVAIKEDDDGDPGDVVGSSDLIDEGTTSDFDAELDRDAADDEDFWAVLYYADGADEFDYDLEAVHDEDDHHVQDDFNVEVVPASALVPAISVEDQELPEDEADTVNIDEADIDEPGFVVVHDEDGGDPDEILGASDVIDGTNTDVEVTLDARDATDGETLYGMLHYDESGDEQFDENEDGAVEVDGDVVVDDFVVTIDEEDETDDDANYIVAEDQTLDGDDGDLSTIVTVAEVGIDAEDGGFAVIHDDECGEGGAIIGVSEHLAEGESTDVEIELDQPAADGGTNADHCAMLHLDDGDGDFDSDDDDPAEEDGDIVEETFNVNVLELTPAIRITLGADGNDSYTNDGVEPSLFADDVGVEDDDVAFDFRPDWRYEINNTVLDQNHPFEFRNDSEDVLLAQQTQGELEDDEETIDWQVDGDFFQFTVSEEFREDTSLIGGGGNNPLDGDEAVSTYGCGVHDDMTGPVEYLD